MTSRNTRLIAGIAGAMSLVTPARAFAADGSVIMVPEWLNIAAVGVGLATAVTLLLGAVLLKEVSEGSSIADNMTYIMAGAIAIAASMLARWGVIFLEDSVVFELIKLISDLLLLAGMAMFSVFFFRVRASLLQFLKYMRQSSPGAEGE